MATPTITKYLSSTLPVADWDYQSVTAINYKDSVTIFETKSQLVQYIVHDAPYLRVWSVTLHYIDTTARDALVSLWQDRQGRAKPFKWVNPDDGQTYYVHFADENLKLERLPTATEGWRSTFTLIEAHPLEIDNDEV